MGFVLCLERLKPSTRLYYILISILVVLKGLNILFKKMKLRSLKQKMDENDVIYCIDCSGSTGNHQGYWQLVASTLANTIQKFGQKNVKCLFWDDKVYRVQHSEVTRRISTRTGGGGTSPHCFASTTYLPEGSNVIIITDGQVSPGDVQKCDRIINGRRFSSVTVIFEHTGGNMNLTVSTPFTRNCDQVKIIVGDRTLTEGSTSKAIDLKRYYDNPDLFLTELDSLNAQIVMQNLGKNAANIPLRNDLFELKKNLLSHIASSQSTKNSMDQVRVLLTSADQLEPAIVLMRSIISNVDTSLGKRLESIFEELARQCLGTSNFDFSVLEPGRLLRANQVEQVTAEELPQQHEAGNFECPISFEEDDHSTLLIAEGQSVFSDLIGDASKKSLLEQLMTNPWMVLNIPELFVKLTALLDHVIGFKTTKELFTRGRNVVSPFSRAPISCALTFGKDATTRRANLYVLARIFFGKRLVGLPESWLSVVYIACTKVPRLQDNEVFMSEFKNYLRGQLIHSKTNITLTGLPIEPLMKTSTDIAIWFSVTSPRIFLEIYEGKVDDARNRLRSFGASAIHLVTILTDVLEYPIDPNTMHQLTRYKTMAQMMNFEKDQKPSVQNLKPWRVALRAQYQNSHTCDDDGTTIILLDGPAQSRPNLHYGAPFEECLALASLVDATKTTNAIPIPWNLQPMTIPPYITNYGYNHDDGDTYIREPLPICIKTMRPYTMDRKKHKPWNVCAEEQYGPLSKQIHNYNYFVQFVMEYEKYPSKEQFLKWTAAKQANRKENTADTLPRYALTYIDELWKDYENTIGQNFCNMHPALFKLLALKSMRKEDRIRLED